MARPKKVLVSVSATEHRGGLRRFLLENRGYQVFQLTNPEDALALLTGWCPRFPALLMTDLNLGKDAMNGNELCRRAKEIVPVRALLLRSRREEVLADESHADRMLCGVRTEELLETLKVMTRLRRGPMDRNQKFMPMKALPAAVWTRRKDVA